MADELDYLVMNFIDNLRCIVAIRDDLLHKAKLNLLRELNTIKRLVTLTKDLEVNFAKVGANIKCNQFCEAFRIMYHDIVFGSLQMKLLLFDMPKESYDIQHERWPETSEYNKNWLCLRCRFAKLELSIPPLALDWNKNLSLLTLCQNEKVTIEAGLESISGPFNGCIQECNEFKEKCYVDDCIENADWLIELNEDRDDDIGICSRCLSLHADWHSAGVGSILDDIRLLRPYK